MTKIVDTDVCAHVRKSVCVRECVCVSSDVPTPEGFKLCMSILVWTLLIKVLLFIHTDEKEFIELSIVCPGSIKDTFYLCERKEQTTLHRLSDIFKKPRASCWKHRRILQET